MICNKYIISIFVRKLTLNSDNLFVFGCIVVESCDYIQVSNNYGTPSVLLQKHWN